MDINKLKTHLLGGCCCGSTQPQRGIVNDVRTIIEQSEGNIKIADVESTITINTKAA